MKVLLLLLLAYLSGCVGGGGSEVDSNFDPAARTVIVEQEEDLTPAIITNLIVPSDNIYTPLEVLTFQAVFDKNVFVTGTPRLALTIGSTTKYAHYQSGTGTTTLLFSYTVEASDIDMNGIALTSLIDLNGGTIRSSTTNNASLNFEAPNLNLVVLSPSGLRVWLDPTASTHVFTDAACTIPAEDTNPIGCLKDRTSYGHNATQSLTARPLYNLTGIQNFPSISFDGVNDKLVIAHHADFDNLSAFTIIVVVLPQTLNTTPKAILSKRDAQEDATFNLFFHTANRAFFDIGANSNRKNSNMIFSANNEYIFTLHFDGALAQAQRTKLYIDGTLDATVASSFAISNSTDAPLLLGTFDTVDTRFFHGQMGEVLIFNKALTTGPGSELEKVTEYLQEKWNL